MAGTLWSEFLRRMLLTASLAGASVTADPAEAALPGKDPAVLPAPGPEAAPADAAAEVDKVQG